MNTSQFNSAFGYFLIALGLQHVFCPDMLFEIGFLEKDAKPNGMWNYSLSAFGVFLTLLGTEQLKDETISSIAYILSGSAIATMTALNKEFKTSKLRPQYFLSALLVAKGALPFLR